MNIMITTRRLLLVPLSLEYAQEIFREFTKEITTYMFPKAPQNIEETKEYITSQLPRIKAGEELPVVIIKKDTGEFLGGGGIHNIKSRTPQLGIWIKKSAHGNKYGKETTEKLKEWAMKNLDFDYLIYPVDKRNIPSRKIAESLGGIIRKKYKKVNQSGNILDEVEYWIYKI